MIDTSNKSKQVGWVEACFYLFYNNMMWISYGTWYVSWIHFVCTRLSQVLSACWIHGLVSVQIDTTNLCSAP